MKENLTKAEVIAFIQEHEHETAADLMLKAHRFPDLPMKDIVKQIEARQKAKQKLPEWHQKDGILFPHKTNLEQSSSEISAKFKASQLTGSTLVDLTGGTGVDCYYISQKFEKGFYIDPNVELCELAVHNFEILNAPIEVVNTTAEDFLERYEQKVDVMFIDPSRRDESKQRVFELEDCTPNILQLMPMMFEYTNTVVMKASPMLDIKLGLDQLKVVDKVQVVAVDHEVKELLFWLTKDGDSTDAIIEAWDISAKREAQSFTFKLDDEQEAIPTYDQVLDYLYEPNSAIMKAGAFSTVGTSFDIDKVHPNTHLYTSERLIKNFPGKALKVLGVYKPDKKLIRKLAPNGQINVICRNYLMGANDVKKKYRLKDGGKEFLVFCEGMENKLHMIHASFIDEQL
jgi:16S rRNA G966 N2-methylase RsmD